MSTPLLFDRAMLEVKRKRALRRFKPGADFLMHRVAEDLGERLGSVLRQFDMAVALGGVTGHIATMLRASGQTRAVIRADCLWPETVAGTGAISLPDLVCHEDVLPFAAQSLDLVVSGLTLQTVDDLPGVLIQIRRALKPDGLFLAALAGGDTLKELRESFAIAETELTGGLSPRVIPFLDVRDLGGLLQRAGFALPVTDSERLTVRYRSMLDLVADLRAMGASNPLLERSRKPIRRDLLMRTAEIYAERFSDPDGRIRATFQILSASAWAPSDTQQKPARRGSATVRLADALGTKELPTGERP